jgi:cell wall-associated NlpC family hydrolase
MITDGIDVSGFKRLSRNTPLDELQHGDWLLLAVGSNYVNHCGIIAEDGMFWHQMENRFSEKSHIAKWERQIKMFLRHKDLA